MKTKQVIVIRKDLNMRKGKIAAQASHASFKVYLDLCADEVENDEISGHLYKKVFTYEKDGHWDNWLNGIFTKIVLSCDSEEELLDLYNQSKNSNLPCTLIVDAGLTEFNGVPTKTCIAIGPDNVDKINEITKKLKLL